MNPDQVEQAQIEATRWIILQASRVGGHIGATDEMILAAVTRAWPRASQGAIRAEIDYLQTRGLVTTERPPLRPWQVKLTRSGRDVVDYTVDCEAGIARPEKYWGGA